MQLYSIKYTTKIKLQNKQNFVYEATASIDASTAKFAVKKLRRKLNKPIKVIDVSIVGYY